MHEREQVAEDFNEVYNEWKRQQSQPRFEGKRFCYMVFETQFVPQGYIPSAIIEGESGHYPMVGKDDKATPWYWGTTMETARKICAKANEDLGLTPEDVNTIVASSMFG